ncbi:conserved hypothetical protein [Cyanobium sp. PCC 7001]|uniref:hypothetical protein n=1 Tax=Cyanobium sp. PCC 7001 TaxID=180281 RepID=UPI000180544B|nr:hypothetical protein [Cyanobium sp. PCC 7001]EDY39564.1 conserved hypothetical protein [Cyanobium sp. PCC 7001]
MSQLAPSLSRQQLRLRSIAWSLGAGVAALLLGLPLGLEAALRAGGCGVLYGLLAFHLQRVDPDDGHLQAGLVGAVCGIHSLALPPLAPWPPPAPLPAGLVAVAPTVMMGLVRAWLPLIGAAVLLHGGQVLVRRLRPGNGS